MWQISEVKDPGGLIIRNLDFLSKFTDRIVLGRGLS